MKDDQRERETTHFGGKFFLHSLRFVLIEDGVAGPRNPTTMVSLDDSACLELLDQMVFQDKRVVSRILPFFPLPLPASSHPSVPCRSQCAGRRTDCVSLQQTPECLSSPPSSCAP